MIRCLACSACFSPISLFLLCVFDNALAEYLQLPAEKNGCPGQPISQALKEKSNSPNHIINTKMRESVHFDNVQTVFLIVNSQYASRHA